MASFVTFRKMINFGQIKNSIRKFSSFIKDENSENKYWEKEYEQKMCDEDAKKESIPYEDLYLSSYNAFQASNATQVDTSQTSQTLTHVDSSGRANMVDVGDKIVTSRSAKAVAEIDIGADAYKLVADNAIKKGDVLSVAQIAGILGAKRTSDLIPLCHPLSLTKVDVSCRLSNDETFRVLIECQARCISRTGVEMEALTGASVAALTIYDMCKAVNKRMVIGNVKVVEKSGGKSDFKIEE